MAEFLANYPSLYSHKGTPVRLVLTTSTGGRIVVDPLRYTAGGLVMISSIANGLLPERVAKPGVLALIDNAGRVVSEINIDRAQVTSVEVFVVYPNGSTWTGNVFDECIAELGLLVWSWELGRRMKLQDHASVFGLKLAWPEVPTTVGFLEGATAENCGCAFAHHSCPQKCEAISKFM